jgi:hypothetical protein
MRAPCAGGVVHSWEETSHHLVVMPGNADFSLQALDFKRIFSAQNVTDL